MKRKLLLLFFIIFIATLSIFSLKNVKADEGVENYSIDYLLKHYNAVALGTKENNILNEFKQSIQGTNKGDIKNLNVEGPVLARGEYANKVNENVDFDKMYAQVMNESQMLVDMTEYRINDYYINIDSPGVYMINNTSKSNNGYQGECNSNGEYISDSYNGYNKIININNYNPNKYYVFNLMDAMIIMRIIKY